MSSPWPPEDDVQAVDYLLKTWYAMRDHWVDLLRSALRVKDLGELLASAQPGRHPIPRTDFSYQVEGGAIDIRKPGNKGGITFRVAPDGSFMPPDEDQLRQFLVKSLNWGTIDKTVYRPLLRDRLRFHRAASKVLAAAPRDRMPPCRN